MGDLGWQQNTKELVRVQPGPHIVHPPQCELTDVREKHLILMIYYKGHRHTL